MAIKLLGAVTGTGASVSKTFDIPIKNHTVQITVTGSPTAVTVDLEGSLDDPDDGFTFFQIATHPFSGPDITAQNAMFHVTDKAVTTIRVNLTVLTGGTAPTVTALYEGIE